MYTVNGAQSYTTTYDPIIDLFFRTTRGIDNDNLLKLVNNSLDYSHIATMRTLFHTRDCRGGKGERRVFVDAMRLILNGNTTFNNTIIYNLIELIPHYGTYKDLLVITLGTPYEDYGIDLYAHRLVLDMHSYEYISKKHSGVIIPCNCSHHDITLAAKWAPSVGQNLHKKYPYILNKLIKAYNKHRHDFDLCRINLCKYRTEVITPLRRHLNIVETPVCFGRFSLIDYNKVPAKALSNYKDIFMENDKMRFKRYLDDISTGKKLMKVSTLYPYEIIAGMSGVNNVSELQWKQLVSQIGRITTNTLVVVDTSGSMTMRLKHTTKDLTYLDVAVSISLLIHDCNITEHIKFPSSLITFSRQPSWINVPKNASLFKRVNTIMKANWQENTNLTAVFELILKHACETAMPQHEMPKQILILSDMQFDAAKDKSKLTNFEYIQKLYKFQGYNCPKIIFWNLSGEYIDFPATKNDNVTLVSGFSHNLLKTFLSAGTLRPIDVVFAAINAPRYDRVGAAFTDMEF